MKATLKENPVWVEVSVDRKSRKTFATKPANRIIHIVSWAMKSTYDIQAFHCPEVFYDSISSSEKKIQ